MIKLPKGWEFQVPINSLRRFVKGECYFCIDEYQPQSAIEAFCEDMNTCEYEGARKEAIIQNYQNNLLSDELTRARKTIRGMLDALDNSTNTCQSGCKLYYGGEIRHDKNCVHYPESMTKMLDTREAELAEARQVIQGLVDTECEQREFDASTTLSEKVIARKRYEAALTTAQKYLEKEYE